MNKQKMNFLLTIALLIILGMLTPLSFAPYYQFWLMPVIFAVLVAVLHRRASHAGRLTYLFAVSAFVCQFYWVHTALHDVSGLPNLYAIPLTFLLPLFLATFPALSMWAWQKCRLPTRWHIALALPVFWTTGEWAREQLLSGFGFAWGALGYSQIAEYAALSGFAPIAGIHLLTLLTACSGAWLFLLWQEKCRRHYWALAILALWCAGWGLKTIEFTQSTGKVSTVALVQGNIQQSLKFDPLYFQHTLKQYLQLVSQAKADMVVLPETAIPAMLQDLPAEWIWAFAQQAERNGADLALGSVRYHDDGLGYLNVMLNLSQAQEMPVENIPFYAKNHLVPFGEYKPLPWLTEPLYRLMNMPLADFKQGGEGQKPFAMSEQMVAFNICYEDGFGDELIASAKLSSVLANASNMAWYGDSNAMYQQLQQSQARAMELGRYMIRATNTGATAIVNHKGQITAQLPANVADVLYGEVVGYQGETPYMRMGGSQYVLAVLLLSIIVMFYFAKRNSVSMFKEK